MKGGDKGWQRPDGRRPDQLREVRIERHYLQHAEGSVLISMGRTKLICTASVEESVPYFLRNSGQGWVKAEYGMLPRSTKTRTIRESVRGSVGGRTHEIERLIGRALRAITELQALGERTIIIDCDVIQADGGTRTAAITGGFVALYDAVNCLQQRGLVQGEVITDFVAAVSVGLVEGIPLLDLCYDEDSMAEVNMNVAMTGNGRFVEIQGTAEQTPFTYEQMERLITLAQRGISKLIELQRQVLGMEEMS